MDQIQTFDLIGFQGTGIVSRTCAYLQKRMLSKRSKNLEVVITHVGLAIRGSDINNLPKNVVSILENRIDSNKVYIFESHIIPRQMDRVPDVFGSFPRGVKLRPLDEIVSSYHGRVFYSAHKFQTNQSMIGEFVDFIIQNNQRPYERSVHILLSNVFRCFKTDKQTDSVFCSELIAKLLKKVKVLPESVNPEKVVPLDFYCKPYDPTIGLDVDKEIPILFYERISLK